MCRVEASFKRSATRNGFRQTPAAIAGVLRSARCIQKLNAQKCVARGGLQVSDPVINTLGCRRGVGEIGITGMAAVANAVYHATGKRVRDLPITLDKLL